LKGLELQRKLRKRLKLQKNIKENLAKVSWINLSISTRKITRNS